jgi:hypothetical protein
MIYGIMEYASFLDSNKHIMANTRQSGIIMRRHYNFEKLCSNKIKKCGIERF